MKKKLLLLLIIPMLITSGCWDRLEIETRAFILGIAVDKYPPNPRGREEPGEETASAEEENKLEHAPLHTDGPIYAMTIQIPVINKSLSRPQGQTGGGGGPRTWELTQIGNSLFEMENEFASRMNLTPYFGHLQVIVISDSIAKEGLERVLDFFDRDPDMRRETKIFISEGQAKKILDTMPRIEDYASIYLDELPINSKVNASILRKSDVGETLSHIHAGKDFILQLVEATKDEINLRGAAVFKGDRMVGLIEEADVESIKFITSLYEGGVMTAAAPEKEQGIIALRIYKVKTKVKPVLKGSELSFLVEIKGQADYAENLDSRNVVEVTSDYLKKVEAVFEKKIEKQCQATVRKMQKQFEADVFHFGKDVLRSKAPAYWDEVKDNWEKIFLDVKVEFKVDLSIKAVGNTR